MNTAFQTGPGFFAAQTAKVDRTIPLGIIRIYCARLEAYDLPHHGDDPGLETTFEILAAKVEKDPRLARALLLLADHVNGNRELIEEAARL